MPESAKDRGKEAPGAADSAFLRRSGGSRRIMPKKEEKQPLQSCPFFVIMRKKAENRARRCRVCRTVRLERPALLRLSLF